MPKLIAYQQQCGSKGNRMKMVQQQQTTTTTTVSPTSTANGLQTGPMFGSRLVDGKSSTPYSDATQVGIVYCCC